MESHDCHPRRHRVLLLQQPGRAGFHRGGGVGTGNRAARLATDLRRGRHRKPIVLVDIDRYYRPLLAMIEHGIELQFIKPKARESLHVADSADAALRYLASYVPPAGEGCDEINSASK